MEPKEVGFDAPWKAGFHITFENGNTVSVQFGAGNYCDHYHSMNIGVASRYIGHSGTAEIAAWDKKGRWIIPEDWDDTVGGWQTPAQVLEFMNYIAGL